MEPFEERMRLGAGAVKEATGFFMKDDPDPSLRERYDELWRATRT